VCCSRCDAGTKPCAVSGRGYADARGRDVDRCSGIGYSTGRNRYGAGSNRDRTGRHIDGRSRRKVQR
jgi:hypothetical protein